MAEGLLNEIVQGSNFESGIGGGFPVETQTLLQGYNTAYAVQFIRYLAQMPDMPIVLVEPGGNTMRVTCETLKQIQALGGGDAPIHVKSFDNAYAKNKSLLRRARTNVELYAGQYTPNATIEIFGADWNADSGQSPWDDRLVASGGIDVVTANPPFRRTDIERAYFVPEEYRDQPFSAVAGGSTGVGSTKILLDRLAPLMSDKLGACLLFRCSILASTFELGEVIQNAFNPTGLMYDYRFLNGASEVDDLYLQSDTLIPEPRSFIIQLQSRRNHGDAVDSVMTGVRASMGRLAQYLGGRVLNSIEVEQFDAINRALTGPLDLTISEKSLLIDLLYDHGDLRFIDDDHDQFRFGGAFDNFRWNIICRVLELDRGLEVAPFRDGSNESLWDSEGFSEALQIARMLHMRNAGYHITVDSLSDTARQWLTEAANVLLRPAGNDK